MHTSTLACSNMAAKTKSTYKANRNYRLYFISLIFLMITLSPLVQAQQVITLQECIEKSMQNHPTGMQKEKLQQVNELNREVISSGWLPQLGMNALASYQSDVTQIDITLPGMDIPSPSQDQYRMTLEAQQMIYDGGTSKGRQALRESTHAAELQEVEVQIYQLPEQVNRHFFQHFILQENLDILNLNMEEIRQRISNVSSAITHGALLPSSQWVLEAEVLRLEQAQQDLLLSIESNRQILEILVGENLSDRQLELPAGLQLNTNQGINRPELKLFALQKEKLFSAAQLTSTTNRPRLGGFVQAGYGKPGLNMLSDDFDFFYMAGIRLSWNIWDWQKSSNERQIHHLKASMIDARQQAFEQNITIASHPITTRLSQLEEALKKDQEIIALHQKIVDSSASQLENGVINSTEYLHQLNALAKAKIEHHTHQIRWIQTIAEYNIITGNF